MRAWLLDNTTGLGALRLVNDAPVPKCDAGQVRIRVQYAALNPADRFLAENLYPARPAFPHILGRDGSGVIDEVGPGVSGLARGDRVAILRGDAGVDKPGTLAEYVVVPSDVVVPIPQGWSEQEAAAGPLVYLTAYQALTMWGPLEGADVLVTGATGGVGLASVHLAKALGFRVIGLTRGMAKRQRLIDEGCDAVLDPEADLKPEVKRITGGKGVDLVVDNVAGPLFNKLPDLLADRGRISVVGMLGGPVPSFNTAKLIFRRVRIGGVLVSGYTVSESRAAWREIVNRLAATNRKPVVDSVFPFRELRAAFDRLAAGPFGKVLIHVGD